MTGGVRGVCMGRAGPALLHPVAGTGASAGPGAVVEVISVVVMSHVCMCWLHWGCMRCRLVQSWLGMACVHPLFSLQYKLDTLCSFPCTCIQPKLARSSRQVVQVALYCHLPRLRKRSVTPVVVVDSCSGG